MSQFKQAIVDLTENEKRFLRGLARLTRETGICIDGCGCCGSPFLSKAIDVDDFRSGYGFGYANNVIWIEPSKKYAFHNYAHTIVRDEPDQASLCDQCGDHHRVDSPCP